jgi:hypothetical protein
VISAAQSLTARLLLTFTSIACLRRPVTEQTRLLTATEISALDMMTTSLAPINVNCLTFPSLDEALSELRSPLPSSPPHGVSGPSGASSSMARSPRFPLDSSWAQEGLVTLGVTSFPPLPL